MGPNPSGYDIHNYHEGIGISYLNSLCSFQTINNPKCDINKGAWRMAQGQQIYSA
jgi:hypothetical protein